MNRVHKMLEYVTTLELMQTKNLYILEIIEKLLRQSNDDTNFILYSASVYGLDTIKK